MPVVQHLVRSAIVSVVLDPKEILDEIADY